MIALVWTVLPHQANTTKTFPSAEDKFTFDIAGPAGVNKVLALASKTELNLDDIARITRDQTTAFATVTVKGGQNGLAQALSIVVKPLASQDWVTDVAQYQISAKVAATITLSRVYSFYANQLKAQGYVEREKITGRTQVVGTLRFEDNGEATLTVKQRPRTTTYDVVSPANPPAKHRERSSRRAALSVT